MARTFFTLAALGLLAGCSMGRTLDRLQQNSPPPEFGRPGWVRVCAGTGAVIGGVAGGVVSIVLLPVTFPISLLAGDHLGGEMTRNEFLLLPATWGAAAGHFLLGAPPDVLDFVFRRGWSAEPLPENTFELVAMEPPLTPQPTDAVPPAAQPPQAPATEPKEPPKDKGPPAAR